MRRYSSPQYSFSSPPNASGARQPAEEAVHPARAAAGSRPSRASSARSRPRCAYACAGARDVDVLAPVLDRHGDVGPPCSPGTQRAAPDARPTRAADQQHHDRPATSRLMSGRTLSRVDREVADRSITPVAGTMPLSRSGDSTRATSSADISPASTTSSAIDALRGERRVRERRRRRVADVRA